MFITNFTFLNILKAATSGPCRVRHFTYILIESITQHLVSQSVLAILHYFTQLDIFFHDQTID